MTSATPSRITCSAVSPSQIDVSWSGSGADTTHYYLERSTDGGATWAVIVIAPVTRASYSDTGLTAATTYTYRVRGWNGATYGSYTASTSATTWGTIATAANLVMFEDEVVGLDDEVVLL